MGRPFEVVPVGLSILRLRIEKVLLEWNLGNEREGLREARRRAADFAMAHDLIAGLTQIKTETEAIEDILNLFSMLFAPAGLSYLPVFGSEHGDLHSFPETFVDSWSAPGVLAKGHQILEKEKGFLLEVSHDREVVGMIKVVGVAFPHYLDRYVGLAVTMGKICGLAISNARIYNVIKKTEEDLRLEIGERKKAEEARKRMEAEIVKLQKMEAMSLLAGGIAHDFNNLLGVVVAHIGIAQMDVDPESPVAEELEAAHRGIKRAGELIKKFLAVSEAGMPTRRAVDLKALVSTTVQAVGDSCRTGIENAIQDGVWQVEADPIHISRALRSIIENAGEATISGQPIRVSAENISIPPDNDEMVLLAMKPGRHVKISITDQGVGIPRENFDRIFDPYFSTKARGTQKGMGMGLTIAYSIIRKHEGYVQVESKPGEGTVVNVYLPAVVCGNP